MVAALALTILLPNSLHALRPSCPFSVATMFSKYLNEDSLPPENRDMLTIYFGPKEREEHIVNVADGMFIYRKRGVPVFTEVGGYLTLSPFAFSTDEELFVASPEQLLDLRRMNPFKSVHHSSFTGGKEVLGVGNIGVALGRLIYIDDNSGHYDRKPEHLVQVLEWLFEKGVVLRDVRVQFIDQNSLLPELLQRLLIIGVREENIRGIQIRPLLPEELPSDAYIP